MSLIPTNVAGQDRYFETSYTVDRGSLYSPIDAGISFPYCFPALKLDSSLMPDILGIREIGFYLAYYSFLISTVLL